MIDGSASLMTLFFGVKAAGFWTSRWGENLLDTGVHFYNVYETADRKYISIGPIEPKFFAELLCLLGLKAEHLTYQMDKKSWPEMHEYFQTVFKTKTRDEWCSILEGTDAYLAPVLFMDEALNYPHNKMRGIFIDIDGLVQPSQALHS